MRLSFIEAEDFTGIWTKLGLTVDDLFSLQNLIGPDPTIHPVVRGTGGLRKMRFAKPSSGKGKRGSFRVCFVYFHGLSTVVLVWVYPKNQKSDLTAAEKKGVRRWIDHV